MKLKPIPTQEELEARPLGWDNPIVNCELCGLGQKSHLMYHITIGLPVAGHPKITSAFCQHWGCTDCWQDIAHACIEEHIIPHVTSKLQEVSNEN